MRISRVIIIVLVVVVVVIIAVAASSIVLAPKQNSSAWSAAAEYPVQVGGTYGIAGQQCVNSTAYITCIGGQDIQSGPRSDIYYSSAVSTSGGIATWTLDSANPYPKIIDGESCVTYAGYVYCVGGTYDGAGDDVVASYYAPLASGGGVGNWSSTTPFPIPVDSQSCVAATGYMYCVGGDNETDGTNTDAVATNSVWYASLSASGLGTWTPTTGYPVNTFFPSCFSAYGYIYCLGGADENDNSLNAVYFAALSPSGVGTWAKTQPYPIQESGQACAFSSGYVYCVGGETSGGNSPSYTNAVYYAPVSPSGIGAWKQAGVYPLSVGTTCIISSAHIYCVGGFDSSTEGVESDVNYASLTSLSASTTSG